MKQGAWRLLAVGAAAAAAFGCDGVLGLEDRGLDVDSQENTGPRPRSDGASARDAGAGGDAGSTLADQTAAADAGFDAATADDGGGDDGSAADAAQPVTSPPPPPPPPPPAGPCDATSVPVYEFNGGDSRWRYSTSPTAEAGETSYGALFKTMSTAYQGTTIAIYALADAASLDTLVSTRADEGGYALVQSLGRVASPNAAPSGTLKITRYYRATAPTRHRLFANQSDATIGQWSIEPNVFYACPLE